MGSRYIYMRRHNKIGLLASLPLIFLLLGEVKAQEMLGISNSNFAGNMGTALNPSSFVGAPYASEFNILSGDLFFDNDYFYLKRRSRLFSKSISGESVPEENFGDYNSTTPKNGYGSIFLKGPSYLSNGEKWSWGFHTAFRTAISATDVPYHVAKFMKEGLDYSPQQNIRYNSSPFRSASASWLELGGTIGKTIYEKQDKDFLTAAVTVKLLAGFNALYVNINSLDYMVPSDDTIVVYDLAGNYGYAFNDGMDGGSAEPFRIRGWGGGVDLGFTYYHKKQHGAADCNKSAERIKKYQYRLGLSLIDLGFINFGRQTKVHSFEGNSTLWPGIDTLKFDSFYQIDSVLSQQFYGNAAASSSGSSMQIFLPTALSLQFDYCILPSVYVNATLVQAIPMNKQTGIKRASQVALTPRYETRRFEVAMPLTFYEYQTPHLGLAFRYGIFVLGTDRLGSFTGLWNTTGYDLFFGFKLNFCDRNGSGKRKKGADCPAYSASGN